MRRWKVKAKGAIVREAAALDSAKVGTLQAKQACASDASCYVDGKERVRLVEPLAGWVSTKCLAAVREPAADADRTMVDARGRGLADVASSGADASTKCLWLDNNAIETADVSGCPGLETLVLTNNRVATVVGALDELREFVANGNALAALPGGLGKARDIVLDDNALAALPEALGDLGELQTLFAQRNEIASLPAAVGALGRLQTLGLAGNLLSRVPRELGRATHLRRLELRHNRLAALPDELGDLALLEALLLDHNRLAALPRLDRLDRLEVLDCARNELKSCELAGLTRLRDASLDDNRLAACPETPPSLARLWLHGNGLAAPPTRARCYVERGDGAVLGAGVATLPFRNFAAAKRARHCVVAFGVERLGEWGGVLHRARPDVDAGFVFDSRRTGYADAGGFRSWLETLADTYDVLSFVGSSQGAFGCLRHADVATGAVLAFSPMRHDCNVPAVDWQATFPPLAGGGAAVRVVVGKAHARDVRAARELRSALGPAVAVVELDSAGHGADMLIPDRAALDAYVREGLPR
ncbi:hypothetical protein SO694_00003732 [Aureococcus anophagefferens]|uniref:Leucine-rich repeat domain-containing protein n=1 Tax=Aureococcus anophagefferens TaxID=44056 RepID=A0ABR1GDW8_AURAN